MLPREPDDVLEMDEVVTFVGAKWFNRWLWTAQCRRTRQIIAFVIGDRSETTAQKLGFYTYSPEMAEFDYFNRATLLNW